MLKRASKHVLQYYVPNIAHYTSSIRFLRESCHFWTMNQGDQMDEPFLEEAEI